MKANDLNRKIDLYITLIIAYFLILIISFSYFNLENSIENYIMITVVMIVALISYYLSKGVTLISILIIDFIYCTYNFYLSITKGGEIKIEVFYWVLIIPLTALLVALISSAINEQQERIRELSKENENYVMIDYNTGLRNLKAFMNEAPIYINLYRRYKVDVTLVLVRIKYSKRLTRIVGKDYFNKVLIRCSEVLKGSLRFEDGKYILDKNTFGFIIISDKNGSKIVKDRLRSSIEELKVGKADLYRNLNIEVEVGSYTTDEKVKDAMDLINFVEKELEYDV